MTQKSQAVGQALRVAADVYGAFRRAARPGATERELEAAVLSAAREHPVRYDLLSGPRTAGVEGGATERALEAGDPLLLDLCLRQGEYWCDVCRTYFVGEPAPDARQTYEQVLRCMRAVADLLRPGAEAAAIYRAAEAYFAANGMQGMLKHHTGHGIGLTPFEPPVETPGSPDVLRAGDIVTVEIGAYAEGRFGIRLEDDYEITARGAAPLWREPIALQDAVLKEGLR